MCGPPALALIGAGVQAGGQIMGGLQARAQGRYEAAVANRNAQLVNAQAQDAQQRATFDRNKLDRQYGSIQGQQTAGMAANGIELGFGSAARVADDTRMARADDAAALYANEASELLGFDIGGSNDRAQAVAARQRGNGAFVKSLFDATQTALGAAQQYKRA